MELGSQFFPEYKDKLAAFVGDNRFRESMEFLYIIQEQLGNNKY